MVPQATTNKIVFYLSLFVFSFFLSWGNSAYAASLNLSPSSGNLTVGNILNVSIVVGTDGQAINSADAVINFPASLLEVISVSKSGSIFTLWVEEPAFSNATGRVTLSGGLPTPGYNGSSGRVVNIAFRVKAPGTASLFFSSASVRANDGLGTDILSSMGTASYTLTALPPAETPPPAPQAETPAASGDVLRIRSSTHPDQARWYNSASPSFSWDLPAGALEVRTIVSENPKATPTVRYTTPISSKTVDKLADGTHYFFVQVKTRGGWSEVSRYQVNIDTTPPEKFRITFPHGSVSLNPQPIIQFNTTDNASGIDRYEVKVGAGGPLATAAPADSNPYTLPLQEPGVHKVAVTVFDRAGNSSSAEADFTIEGIEAPRILSYSEEMSIGDILKIRGTTYPNAVVEITISQDDEPVATETTKSNSLGDFSLVISKRLWQGTYAFTARVTDDRGARSAETPSYAVTVRLQFFTDALAFILNYFLIALSAIIGIAIIAAVGIWSWYKLLRLTRTLKKETYEVQAVVHRSFKIMKTGVDKHIRQLHKARGTRTLTAEELEFLEQFKDTLSEAEHVISRKIDKIPTKKS